jgi:predicted NUDIX family phosphoesterase
MNKEDELVLCWDKVPPFTGVVLDYQFDPDESLFSFQRRGDAETDETRRQIIPYIIVINEYYTNEYSFEVLTYKRGRKGGEERLHDLYTFGVGGHINPEDVIGKSDPITNALYREIKEEIGLDPDDFSQLNHVGWVALDRTPVDRVHLGKIYIISIKQDAINKIKPEEGAFEETKFMRPEDLTSLNMEDWSRTILPELKSLVLGL